MKKTYAKPVIVSRRIALGVFGSYSSRDGSSGGDNGATPVPVHVIDDRKFKME